MLIETIKGMKNSEIAFLSTIIQGQVSGATKNKLKSITFGFASDCFQNPETIGDIMHSKLFGIIIMEKKLMNQETLKRFKDSQKKNNTNKKGGEKKNGRK